MKVIGLDDREYVWNFHDRIVYDDDIRKRSELHMRCRNILSELYPLYKICEEVPLPGSGRLTIDFYIPDRRIAVECQGRQHYEFIPHFHGTRMGFVKAKKNDVNKRDWCQKNNIRLVELKYDGTDEQWRERIKCGGEME